MDEPRQRNRSTPPGRDEADRMAVTALTCIAGDPAELAAFLQASGLEPAGLRAAAGDPGFLAGVLAYVAGNEALLVTVAHQAGTTPERLAAAERLVNAWEDG